jgi:hypothetical protein
MSVYLPPLFPRFYISDEVNLRCVDFGKLRQSVHFGDPEVTHLKWEPKKFQKSIDVQQRI